MLYCLGPGVGPPGNQSFGFRTVCCGSFVPSASRARKGSHHWGWWVFRLARLIVSGNDGVPPPVDKRVTLKMAASQGLG